MTKIAPIRIAPAQASEPLRETETLSVLAPIARSSIVDAVVERIRGEILGGRIVAGSRLPSERELALALGINRLTLRAALARLEAIGLVVTKHGAGTVVASWRERAGLDALGALAQALPETDPARTELLSSILEVRRVLAAEAVALAAARATKEDIATLRAIADAQRANVHDPVAMARGDVAFQRAVIRAARNVGLELILNSFARFPDEQPELVAQLYDEPSRTLEHYPLVIGLIESKDERVRARARSRRARGHGPRARQTRTRRPRETENEEVTIERGEAMMALTTIERRWARTAIETMFPSGGIRGADVIDSGEGLERICQTVPARVALGLRVAVWLVTISPLLVALRFRTLASLAADEREKIVLKLLSHRSYFLRQLALLLKAFGALMFVAAPGVRESIVGRPSLVKLGLGRKEEARHVA